MAEITTETGLKIDYGRELGVDLKMIQAAGARIREAIGAASDLSDTLLVVKLAMEVRPRH